MTKRILLLLALLALLLPPGSSALSSGFAQQTPPPAFEGQIAYVGADGNVWVLRGDGSKPIQVTMDAGTQRHYYSPRWSPDGARLAYCQVDQIGSGSTRLFVTWTGEWLPLAVSQDIYCKDSPAGVFDWSLDGSRIFYARNFSYNPQPGGKVWDPYYGIWETNVVSGVQRELVPPPGDNPLVSPALSPDGHWVRFYELIYQEGLGVLRTWNTMTNTLGSWLASGSKVFPGLSSWSPDGSQLVFDQVTYAGFPGAGLFIADADGSNVKKIYAILKVSAVQPLWSPDGQNIAFELLPIAKEVKGNRLALIGPDGKNLHEFFRSDAAVAPVVWSPSGKQLLFGEGAAQGLNLMLYDLATDSKLLLAAAGAWVADWSPLPSGPPPAASLPPDALLDFPFNDDLLVYVDPDYAAVISNTLTSHGVALTRPMSVAGFTPSPSRHNLVYGTRWMTLDFRDGGKLSVHTTSLPAQPAEGKLSWAPGETRLAFQAQDGSAWVVDLGGKSLQIPGAATTPLWSSDGKYLSYCTVDPSSLNSLWLVGPTSPPKKLADLGVGLCQQSWSSSQNLLAYSVTGGEGGQPSAFVYDLASDKTTPLILSTTLDSWSPDGKYLALRRPDVRGFVVFAVEPVSGKQLFVGRFDDRNLGLVGWRQTPSGYLFGPYRISDDLSSANKAADVLFDATADGSTLLVGIGSANLLTLACLKAETGVQSKLLTFDLSLVPTDQKPGVWAHLSPDGVWVLARGYSSSAPLTSLYRCDGASQVPLPQMSSPAQDGFSLDGRWYAYPQVGADGKGELVLQDLTEGITRTLPAMQNSIAYWIKPLAGGAPQTFLVSGRVLQPDGSPLAGVSILVDGKPAATSGEDGTYLVSGLSKGKHTLSPQKEGYLFAPAEGKASLPPDTTGLDFSGSLPSTGTPPPPPTPTAAPVAAVTPAPPAAALPLPTALTDLLVGVPPLAVYAIAGLLILLVLLAMILLLRRGRRRGKLAVSPPPVAPLPAPAAAMPKEVIFPFVAPSREEAVTPTQPVKVQPLTAAIESVAAEAPGEAPPTQPVPVEAQAAVPPTQPVPVESPEETPAAQPVPVEAAEAPVPAVKPAEDLHALLQAGISQVKGSQVSQGMEKLRHVLQLDPENATAWLWLGWAAAQQKDIRLAERCFRRAQKLGHPKAEDGLRWLARKR